MSALLLCRCANACELPGSHSRAVSDSQGFVNLAALCIWHWREMLHSTAFLCVAVSLGSLMEKSITWRLP